MALALLGFSLRVDAGDCIYPGVCDGSAAVALSADCFVTASDEQNKLRIYQRGVAAPARQVFGLAQLIDADPRHPESDIEAATRLGDTVFWITSHSLSRTGKQRTGRGRFFATRFVREAGEWRMELVGQPRNNLVESMIAAPALSGLKLAEAAERPPQAKDGLNIEGLCATPEGALFVGFRNPIRGGRALLVPLLNPLAFAQGASPEFGTPRKLALDGLGIRDLAPWAGGYLIAAGAARGGGRNQLWFWPGGDSQPRLLQAVDLSDFNAEAIVTYPGLTDAVELLSDDSGDGEGATGCGKLPAAQRSFRGRIVKLPELGKPTPQ